MPSKSMGAMPKNPTSATWNAEPVRSSTYQISIVICIHREM